jgi:hypothetical protein
MFVFLVVAMCGATDYMAEMRTLQSGALLDVPPEVKESYIQARKAESAHDGGRTAYPLYCQLASLDSIGPGARTLFLLKKAGLETGMRRPGDAVETLRFVVALRGDDTRVQYLADLQIAKLMAQQGGGVPEFAPTIADMERQYQRIFSLYSPYNDREIIVAKLTFADEAMGAAMQDPRLSRYAEEAVRQVIEAQAIIDEVEQDPSLVQDPVKYARMLKMRSEVAEQLVQIEKLAEYVERNAHPEETATEHVVDAAVDDALATLATPVDTGEVEHETQVADRPGPPKELHRNASTEPNDKAAKVDEARSQQSWMVGIAVLVALSILGAALALYRTKRTA